MIWLINLSVVLIFFCQHHGAESRKPTPIPWTDPSHAKSFMSCFKNRIASSSNFQSQETEDMESIVETMISAMTSANSKSSTAKTQAMTAALASSFAEMVVQGTDGNEKIVNIKSGEMLYTVQNCYKDITGTVNKNFINEIKGLIAVLAKEDRAEKEISTEDQRGSAIPEASFGTSKDQSTTPWTSSNSAKQNEKTSYQELGAAVSESISRELATYLINTPVFQSVFDQGLPLNTLFKIAVSATQMALGQIGVSSDQIDSLSYTILNSLSSFTNGANSADYANAIAKTIATGLYNSGQLNSNNVSRIAKDLGIAYTQSFTSQAVQYNIQIRQAGVSTTSTTSTTSSLAGNSGSSTLESGNDAFGAPTTGPVDSFTEALKKNLLSSPVLNSVVSAGLSPSTLSEILIAASEPAFVNIGISAAQSSSISYTMQKSISNIQFGANVDAYATAIAKSVANVLLDTRVLNSGNVNRIANVFGNAYVQSLTNLASQKNIQISQTATSSTSSATSSLASNSLSSGSTLFGSGNDAFGNAQISDADLLIDSNGDSRSLKSLDGTIGSALSSPLGLTSPAATYRIQNLAQGLLKAFGPNGFQFDSLTQGLTSTFASLLNSGLSPKQAQVEVLMESIVALTQILSSAQIGSVNLGLISSVSEKVASSLNSAFVSNAN